MKNNSKSKGKKQGQRRGSTTITHADGFVHLTSEPTLYARSLKSIKEFIIKEFNLPIEVLEGTMPDPDGDSYADWLLEKYPDALVPPEVPDLINIILPENIVNEIEEMAVGVDPNDVAAVEMMTSAQEAVTNIARQEEKIKRNRKLLTLGNLTIITQSLNSSIRDASWTIKRMGTADKKGLNIYSAGLETISDYLSLDEWNEQTIDERAKYLYRKAKEIWKV